MISSHTLPKMWFWFSMALILCGSLYFLKVRLSDLSYEVTQAKREYSEAVGYTRQALVSGSRQVVETSFSKGGIDWNLVESVRGSFQSNLRLGELDQIEIFDANCNQKLLIEAIALSPAGCQKWKKARLFWREGASGSILSFWRPGEPSMLTSVSLGSQWRRLHPLFSATMKSLNLSIGSHSNSAVPLMVEGDSISAGQLTSSRWDLKLTSSFLGPQSLHQIDWLFGFLGLCLLATMILHTMLWSKQISGVDGVFKNLAGWCEKSLEVKGLQKIPKVDHLMRGWYFREFEGFKNFVKQWNEMTQNWQERIFASQTNRQDQEVELLNYREEITDLKMQLAASHQLSALKEQMVELGPGYLSRMMGLFESIEDAQGVFQNGALRQSEKVREKIEEWQDEIHAQGARKFLRSLAERQGEGGQTLLDAEMSFFRDWVFRISDQSIYLTSILERVSKEKALSTTLGHWYSLCVDSSQVVKETMSLSQFLDEAIDIIKSGHGAQFSVIKDFEDPKGVTSPAKKVWIAIFYHCLQGALDLHGQAVGSKIMVKLRTRGGQHFLIFSPVAKQNQLSKRMEESFQHHIAQVSLLLQSCHVECQSLGPGAGVFLAWKTESSSHEQNFFSPALSV